MRAFFVCFMILWLLFNNASYAVLTQDDVRRIIKEENAQLETRLKEYIDMKFAVLAVEIKANNATMVEMDKRITAQINALDNKIKTVQWALGILIKVQSPLSALALSAQCFRMG